ncbi:sterol desaturase family protein [Alicyclobacillus sp. ALC3]|uniref:sterol desaturase family protein n=1 Tax=Alicyclobacillus sp. ALC3 TaxID=2796143 RepID=UPI002379D9E4|nr:sterol desaturase family protein [Alicyclobacillus sp. ALC3]WDL96971.1 sterol desaturase family protein [Alicyclobacillus sp. ALC3]
MKAPYFREFATDSRPLLIAAVFAVDLAAWAAHYRNWMWLVVLAGLAFFYIIEYFIHRYILHGLMRRILPKAYEGHVHHHITPTQMKYLLTPNVYNLPGYIAIWLATWAVTGRVTTTAAFVCGVCLAQLNYEWTHFVSHRPIVPRTAVGRWMKKFHLLHHYMNENYWFGVTHPAMDMLFHTAPDKHKVEHVAPPSEQLP